MKKISLAVALVVALFATSCGNKKSNDTVIETEQTEQVTITDESNAQNSLDWAGTYKGVLPAADTEGMSVSITLSPDSSFTKTYSYVGKNDQPVTQTGKYQWSEDGNIVTLEGIETPNQYFVSEGKIIQLDVNGNPITGSTADLYILTQEAVTE